MFVSDGQRSDSVMHIHMPLLSQTLFQIRSQIQMISVITEY